MVCRKGHLSEPLLFANGGGYTSRSTSGPLLVAAHASTKIQTTSAPRVQPNRSARSGCMLSLSSGHVKQGRWPDAFWEGEVETRWSPFVKEGVGLDATIRTTQQSRAADCHPIASVGLTLLLPLRTRSHRHPVHHHRPCAASNYHSPAASTLQPAKSAGPHPYLD